MGVMPSDLDWQLSDRTDRVTKRMNQGKLEQRKRCIVPHQTPRGASRPLETRVKVVHHASGTQTCRFFQPQTVITLSIIAPNIAPRRKHLMAQLTTVKTWREHQKYIRLSAKSVADHAALELQCTADRARRANASSVHGLMSISTRYLPRV